MLRINMNYTIQLFKVLNEKPSFSAWSRLTYWLDCLAEDEPDYRGIIPDIIDLLEQWPDEFKVAPLRWGFEMKGLSILEPLENPSCFWPLVRKLSFLGYKNRDDSDFWEKLWKWPYVKHITNLEIADVALDTSCLNALESLNITLSIKALSLSRNELDGIQMQKFLLMEHFKNLKLFHCSSRTLKSFSEVNVECLPFWSTVTSLRIQRSNLSSQSLVRILKLVSLYEKFVEVDLIEIQIDSFDFEESLSRYLFKDSVVYINLVYSYIKRPDPRPCPYPYQFFISNDLIKLKLGLNPLMNIESTVGNIDPSNNCMIVLKNDFSGEALSDKYIPQYIYMTREISFIGVSFEPLLFCDFIDGLKRVITDTLQLVLISFNRNYSLQIILSQLRSLIGINSSFDVHLEWQSQINGHILSIKKHKIYWSTKQKKLTAEIESIDKEDVCMLESFTSKVNSFSLDIISG